MVLFSHTAGSAGAQSGDDGHENLHPGKEGCQPDGVRMFVRPGDVSGRGMTLDGGIS